MYQDQSAFSSCLSARVVQVNIHPGRRSELARHGCWKHMRLLAALGCRRCEKLVHEVRYEELGMSTHVRASIQGRCYGQGSIATVLNKPEKKSYAHRLIQNSNIAYMVVEDLTTQSCVEQILKAHATSRQTIWRLPLDLILYLLVHRRRGV